MAAKLTPQALRPRAGNIKIGQAPVAMFDLPMGFHAVLKPLDRRHLYICLCEDFPLQGTEQSKFHLPAGV